MKELEYQQSKYTVKRHCALGKYKNLNKSSRSVCVGWGGGGVLLAVFYLAFFGHAQWGVSLPPQLTMNPGGGRVC